MAMQSGFIKRIRDIMRMDAGINGDAQRIEQMVWMLFLKVYDAKEDDWELNEDNYESIIPEDLRWRNWAKADSNGHAMTGDKLLNFVNNSLFPVLKGNDVKEGDTIIYEGIKVTPDTPIKKAIVKSTFEDANNYMKDGVYLRQVIDVIDEIEFDDVKESHAFGFVYEEILRELQSAGSSGEFYTPRAVTEFMALMIKPKLGEKMADFACGTGGFITSWLGQLSKQVTDTSAQKQLDDSIYGVEKKPFPYLLCVTNMFKGKNVQNGKLVLSFESYIPESVSDELPRSQITKKCLLTPYVGTIGNIAVFDGSFKAHLGSNVGKIELLNSDTQTFILEEYVLWYLKSTYGYAELTKYKKATAQESISIDAIRNVVIAIPPLEEQRRIVAKLEEILPLCERLK